MKNVKVLAVVVGVVGMVTTANAAPIVEITKSCPGLRYLGRNATFEITVTNRGDSVANNVVITDKAPAGISLLKTDNSGSRQGDSIVWRVGDLEAGASKTVTAEFACNTIGTYTNSATVTYCAAMTAECQLEVKGIPAILLECVDNPDPIEVNNNVTYTIIVTNQGSAVGTNIKIECTLPSELKYVSAEGPTRATSEGANVSFDPVPTLAPQAKAVYKVTTKGVGEGDVRFKVQMMSDQIETPVMETESTNVYQ